MARKPKRITVTPGSELAKILNEASEHPVVLETDGELYHLERIERGSEDFWEGYDAEKVAAAIDSYAGIWDDRDADAIIARIYRARAEGSRPTDRP